MSKLMSPASQVSIGYLRVTSAGVERVGEDEAISRLLNTLKACIENRVCTRGVVLSGRLAPIRRASIEYYDALLKSVIGVPTESKTKLKLVSEVLINRILEKPEYLLRGIELIGEYRGVLIGVREGRYIVVPSVHASSAPKASLKTDFLPLTSFVLYPTLKSIRKIEISLGIPPPKDKGLCASKAPLIECYRYRGSSRCIYNSNVRCPLRVLFRKKPAVHIGSAEYWALKAVKIADKTPGSNTRQIDPLIARFLAQYALSLCIATGSVVARLMSINCELGCMDIDSCLKGIRRVIVALGYVNKKASDFIKALVDEVERIVCMNNVYQAKTMLFLILDSIPYKIEVLSRYLANTNLYRVCKPESVREKTILAFIERFFPLIRGKIARDASSIIKNCIEKYGCIEPYDLASIMNPSLAVNLLETLCNKGLLKRVGGKGRVYRFSL